MDLIASLTATGSSNIFDFQNIPQSYDDLYLIGSLRSSSTGNSSLEGVGLALNNTYSGYSEKNLYGTGNGVAVGSEPSYRTVGMVNNADTTSDSFGIVTIYITNYTNTSNKIVTSESVSETNALNARQQIFAYEQSVTSAVNRVTLDSCASGSNWVSGSIVSLYGIRKGSGEASVS